MLEEPTRATAKAYLGRFREVIADSEKLAGGLERIGALLETRAAEIEQGVQDDFRALTLQKPLSPCLDDNIRDLRLVLGDAVDVVFRHVLIGGQEGRRQALVVFVDGLVDNRNLNEHFIRPLVDWCLPLPAGAEIAELFRLSVTSLGEVKIARTLAEVINPILVGETAVLFDGSGRAVVAAVPGWEQRPVADAASEPVVRGPREAFTEKLRTNTALLRRRIAGPEMTLEGTTIGRISRTKVVVAYVRGVASDKIVQEVRRRIQRIRVDALTAGDNIEELIVDQPLSPFPQAKSTERPDVVAADLMEGRVAILVDGSPFALVVPAGFVDFMQAADDYYNSFITASLVRTLRYAFLNIALLLPSLWIAVTTFHPEMIPSTLLLTIAATREGIPFPAFVEALIMEIAFEALREGGLRLPRAVGQAISIVGALIIGQAAVEAGLASPGMVIVVALTGISSFVIPRYSAAFSMRILRFPLMVLAAALGLFGVMIGLLAILVHLASLRSFGVPYLAPLAPLVPGDLKDAAIRAPWWSMRLRPRLIGYKRPVRQVAAPRPGPFRR